MKEFENFPIEDDNWENVDINKYDEELWSIRGGRIGRNNPRMNLHTNNKKFTNKFLIIVIIFILYMVFVIPSIFINYDIPSYTYLVFMSFYIFFMFIPDILPRSKLGQWLNKKTII